MASPIARHHTMGLCSSPRLDWGSLPTELRDMILNTIADQKSPGWASFASVSREWQAVIGKRNMSRLKIRTARCLFGLEHIIVRQREFVRHIDLDVELPRYNCLRCNLVDMGPTSMSASHSVSWAVWQLFSVLRTWKPAGQLTLELNAMSPDDSGHWFKDFYFDDAADQRDPSDMSPSRSIGSTRYDPRHCWVNGRRVAPPPYYAMQRLFGPIHLEFNHELPRVEAITCLMIRRQFRHFLRPWQLSHLVSKLGGLTDIIYEPWLPRYTSPIMGGPRLLYPADFLTSIDMRSARNLKRLTVFRDYNQYLSENLNDSPDELFHLEMIHRKKRFSMQSKDLSQTSLGLEQLAVSFFINAEQFIQACQPEWSWEHLQSLALTSELLQDEERQQEINGLLVSTAKLALRAPKLITMVLWNGSRGKASAFIFNRRQLYASISWRGTWELGFNSSVVEAWGEVAKLHSLELEVNNYRHIQETIKSHGDAIYYLNLPCQVVNPTSLWQIRMEAA